MAERLQDTHVFVTLSVKYMLTICKRWGSVLKGLEELGNGEHVQQ